MLDCVVRNLERQIVAMEQSNPRRFTVELLDGTVMCERVKTPGQGDLMPDGGRIFQVRMDAAGNVNNVATITKPPAA